MQKSTIATQSTGDNTTHVVEAAEATTIDKVTLLSIPSHASDAPRDTALSILKQLI